ncbi:MAG: right-handed parallel beta-helix repeat-containing protein [bacterium]
MRKFFVILFALAVAGASFGQLSGPLEGILGPGYYTVVGAIWVNPGRSLTILPPTTFDFLGEFPFTIWGTLSAIGTESAPIVFTANQPALYRWRAMRFEAGSSGSGLGYCLIEWSQSGQGGGVRCYQSSPTFANCTVRRDSANNVGGGIYCYESTASFTGCIVRGNDAVNAGGGIYCYNSAPTFTNCLIMCNRAPDGGGVYCGNSTATFTNCTVDSNTAYDDGGGVYSTDLSSFMNCRIIRNRAYDDGGGVHCEGSTARFTNCTVDSNMASRAGAGVSCRNSASPTFTNCVITRNTALDSLFGVGGGAYCDSASPVFVHCTLSGNTANSGAGDGAFIATSAPTFNSTIISFSNGTGIYFSNSGGSQIIYGDIFGHSGGNIINPSAGPPGIGELVTTNANGDSCDIYRNIFLDPLFVDPPTADIHLTNYSPCIGAANPANPPPTDFEGDPRPNPPASYPDIGADEHPFGVPLEPVVPVSDLVIRPDFPGSGNMVLYWSPVTGAIYYSIYGATAPFIPGTQLATGVIGTTWTDLNTSSRPSRYFYYVTAVQ